jgi:hypothetical protein
MTKATEELKHAMYRELNQITGEAKFDPFQSALEAYLEALRQESVAKDVRIDHLERMGDVMRDGYLYQQSLTIQARTEADRERNRAQAFEFANKSAGEFLQASQAKVKRQRQSIGQLKNDRDNARNLAGANYTKYQKARKELSELRKLVGSTSAQSSSENVAEVKCEANAKRMTCSFEGMHKHYTGACPHCGSVTL